ncbi:hypothetical protein D3C86_1725860 [compost metagenome]
MLLRHEGIFCLRTIHNTLTRQATGTDGDFGLAYIIIRILFSGLSGFLKLQWYILAQHRVNTLYLVAFKYVFEDIRNDQLRERYCDQPASYYKQDYNSLSLDLSPQQPYTQ